MQTYIGSRATIKIFDNNDKNYLANFNTVLRTFADISFVDAPIDGATEILPASITGDRLVDGTIPASKLQGSITISDLANNTYFKGTNFAGSGTVNIVKVNTSNNIEHGGYWEGLRTANQKKLGSRTVGGADSDWCYTNASDQWEYLNTAYTQSLLPKTTATYVVGDASNHYTSGYIDTLTSTAATITTLTSTTSTITTANITTLNLNGTAFTYVDKGTWTPGLKFGGNSTGLTYDSQVGFYSRDGKKVTATCYIDLASKGSSTGSATVTGLPLTSSGAQYVALLVFESTAVTYTNWPGWVAVLPSGSTTVSLDTYQTGAGLASIPETAFENNSKISFTIVYYVA